MARINNNEAYKLLELTDHSDSDLDLPELVSSPRRKVQRRKLKRIRKVSTSTVNVEPVCVCNVRIFTVWVAAILLTIWIITLTWLVIVLHNEIERLDSAVRQVVASSQGVPDALQKCHTISKSLQNNQSLIITQIGTLKMHLENYNKNVSEMQIRLNLIQEKLHNVPEYVDVPQELKQVSSSIANLGSQIKDITNTVATLKSSKERLETTNNALIQNITKLKNSVNYLQNQSQTPLSVNTENSGKIENIFKIIDAMKVNLTNVNSTLSSNILWIRDDLKLYRKNVEIISNVGQNMSARVSTLEGLCGKSVTQNILSTNIKGVYDELKNITNNIERQALQINDIQMQVFQLSQNSSELSLAINTLNQSLDEKDKSQKQQQIEQEQEQHHQRQMQMQMQQALFNERQIMATSQTESPSSNTVIKEGEKHMATATATATATLMPTPSRSSQMPPTSAPVSSTPPPIQLKDSAKNPTAKPSILTP